MLTHTNDRDEDCDIETLEEHDFDRAFSTPNFTSEQDQWRAFMIGMCGLAHW
jgi:hypothetical protein